jgi:hypothetical protein
MEEGKSKYTERKPYGNVSKYRSVTGLTVFTL